jgi:hypothetical protein
MVTTASSVRSHARSVFHGQSPRPGAVRRRSFPVNLLVRRR